MQHGLTYTQLVAARRRIVVYEQKWHRREFFKRLGAWLFVVLFCFAFWAAVFRVLYQLYQHIHRVWI